MAVQFFTSPNVCFWTTLGNKPSEIGRLKYAKNVKKHPQHYLP